MVACRARRATLRPLHCQGHLVAALAVMSFEEALHAFSKELCTPSRLVTSILRGKMAETCSTAGRVRNWSKASWRSWLSKSASRGSQGPIIQPNLQVFLWRARQDSNLTILITGLAGLLAGAGSMAMGEWISVQSSREL